MASELGMLFEYHDWGEKPEGHFGGDGLKKIPTATANHNRFRLKVTQLLPSYYQCSEAKKSDRTGGAVCGWGMFKGHLDASESGAGSLVGFLLYIEMALPGA